MGVKFNREYEDIIEDLIPAIASIEDCYDFFEMSLDDWQELTADDKKECIRTLADDLFYGLGTSRQIEVGSGVLEYDAKKHLIKIKADSLVHVVNLI